ncbi:MAG: NTP transferase domain-containing protein [Candidatus Thermoplasmatota archaeon]|nr:NTP transferase domain-containing protein [Candidatus Thermoplasmatota archaeon]
MINMTTVLIFAGGSSSRMGQDKSTMYGGVSRIRQECLKANISRIITLCGSEIRRSNFEGEVWPDPKECDSLMDLILWSISQIDDEVLLIPCDAFNLTVKGITELSKQQNCLPLDEQGNRQPLLAKISDSAMLERNAISLNELFAKFPTYSNQELASQFNNFNQNSDLKNLHSQ